MPEYLFRICFFLSDLIQIVIQGSLIITVFNKKTNVTRLLIFGLVNSLALLVPTFVNAQFSPPIRLFLYLVVIIFTIKLVLSTSFFVGILGTGLLFVLSTLIEYICMAIIKLSLPKHFTIVVLEMPFVYGLIIRSGATLIWLIVLGITYYAKMGINATQNTSTKKMIGILLNLIVIIILIMPNMLYFTKNFEDIGPEIIIFNMIMLFVLVIVSVYNTKKFTEINIQKQTIEYQKQYINTLTDAIDGLRGFKHDFNNVVNVIGGYVALEDFEGFKKYFRQLQNDCWTINNVFPLNTYVKNDPAIYGLLLSKISTAEIKNISFNINFNTELEIKQMKSMELYKIIGILLDNAFEAAEETENKYVEVFTRKLNNDEGILIEISNSINIPIDTKKIYTKGYSTKSEHTGFGLWEVKKLVSKYKSSQINTFVNEDMFTQQLKVY